MTKGDLSKVSEQNKFKVQSNVINRLPLVMFIFFVSLLYLLYIQVIIIPYEEIFWFPK